MPPYESSVIIGNLISGAIVMNEFDYYTGGQIWMIFLGTLICVFGIFYKVLRVEKISEKLSIVYNMEDEEFKDHELYFSKNSSENMGNDLQSRSDDCSLSSARIIRKKQSEISFKDAIFYIETHS